VIEPLADVADEPHHFPLGGEGIDVHPAPVFGGRPGKALRGSRLR
jgi:hypothetical protein